MAKKYYWMKLKEDFFDDDAIEWLEEQPKGKEYALFYLKLCLKSLKTGGVLIRPVGTMIIPYDTRKLAEVTKTDFDTVIVAMELLKNIGLIEILEGGEICIPRMEEMIGSETDKAILMRRKREFEKLASGNNVTQMLPDCYPCNDGNNVTEVLPECSEDRSKTVTQRIRDKRLDIREKEIVTPPPDGFRETATAISEFELQCVEILISSCVAIFANAKVPKTDAEKLKWAVEFERMKRIDGRSEAEIIEALTYATTDTFWKSNIRSAQKFRKQFETLIIQSRGKSAKPARNPQNRFHNFEQRDTDYDALVQEQVRGWAQDCRDGSGTGPSEPE